jgi:hypothetical protein
MQGEFYVPNALRSNNFCLTLIGRGNANGLAIGIAGFLGTA